MMSGKSVAARRVAGMNFTSTGPKVIKQYTR